jgi:hypothetical protein
MFSYYNCTDDELLEHVRQSVPAKISVAKRYHESKGNFEIVAKIEIARKKLEQQRLIAKLEKVTSGL